MRLAAAVGPNRRHVIIVAAALALAVVLGGGGTPNPATEVWLELALGGGFLAWLWLPGTSHRTADRWLWLLAFVILIIPVAQLIPLPPSVWHALPGREVQVAALDLVGESESWRGVSTSTSRTCASLLAMIPPVLLMFGVASLSLRERGWIVATIAAMALVSAALGAVQLAGGIAAPRLYEASNPFVITGFQANRNAEVDVLLIGILAVATLAVTSGETARERTRATGWWVAGLVTLLVLAAVLTASRGGIVLIVPTLLACWAILATDPAKRWNRGTRRIAAATLVLLAGGALLLQISPVLQRIAARFDLTGEGRAELWRDTSYAIAQFWPFGAGIGTFVPNFIAFEPLEAIDPSAPNRAHNEYLELMLEAGAFGIAVLAIAIALVLFLAVRGWRRNPAQRPQILMALGTLLLIAAHSLVDYPLRSMTLACLAGSAVGLLAIPPKDRSGREGKPASLLAKLPATVAGAIFLWAAWGSGFDRLSLLSPALERLVPPPFRATADRSAAAMALARGEKDAALAYARDAVRADPLDPFSASLLGSARQLAGDTAGADAAFRVSAQRGWRDRLTQLYWYDAALRSGDVRLAAMRADALLRAAPGLVTAVAVIEPLEETEEGRKALAARLAERPAWLQPYLWAAAQEDAAALARRVDVVARVGALGRPLGCDAARGFATTLLARGMRREAARVWSIHCGKGGPVGGISDGGFEQLADAGTKSPFGWARHTSGDVDVETVTRKEGGAAVRAENSSSVTQLVLSQAVDLVPGTYRVQAAVGGDGGATAGRLVVSIDCNGQPRRPVAPDGDIAQAGQRLTVGSCTQPVLGLWLRPGGGSISIDDVRILRSR